MTDMKGHSSVITALQFSPDGKLLASGGEDSQVILWNTSDWSQNLSISDFSGPISDLEFSPDGKQLAAETVFGSIRIIDPTTGKNIIEIKNNYGSIAWSLDSKELYNFDGYGHFVTWDPTSGQQISDFPF